MSKRIQFILENFGADLYTAACRVETLATLDELHLGDGEALVKHVAQHDPTRNKQYTQWMVQTYIRNGYRLEDLGQLRHLLALFAKNRGKMTLEARDIGQYKRMPDLWDAVAAFDKSEEEEELTGRALKRSEREIARSQSRILRETKDGLIVVIPKTPFAAQWWGKGTRWCTTSHGGSMFNTYSKQGPLVITVFPDGRKVQAHAESGQFMDEQDRPLSKEFISDRWTQLLPMLKFELRRCGNAIEWFPEQRISPRMIEQAMKTGTRILTRLPDRYLTMDFIRQAVETNPNALDGVIQKLPKSVVTQEFCNWVVERRPASFSEIPPEFRTKDMCIIAVKGDGDALRHVSKEMIDDAMIDIALDHQPGAIKYAPVEKRKFKHCQRAVEHDGMLLEFCPEEFKTPELCMKAVAHKGEAVKHASPKAFSQALYDLAVENGANAKYIPTAFWTDAIADKLVRNDGTALALIRKDKRTLRQCLLAVRQARYALGYVPRQWRTPQMCMIAIMHDPTAKDAYEDVPKELRELLQPFGETELWKSFDPDDESWLPAAPEMPMTTQSGNVEAHPRVETGNDRAVKAPTFMSQAKSCIDRAVALISGGRQEIGAPNS